MGDTRVIPVTLTVDTGAYASGDLLADTQAVGGAFTYPDKGGVLQTVTVVDGNDQGAAFDIWIAFGSGSFGSENSAPSIADADAALIQGRISIGTGDYYDLGGNKTAFLSNLAIPIRPAAGTTTFYIAAVNGTGAPTYASGTITVNLGILPD